MQANPPPASEYPIYGDARVSNRVLDAEVILELRDAAPAPRSPKPIRSSERVHLGAGLGGPQSKTNTDRALNGHKQAASSASSLIMICDLDGVPDTLA
mgnify:CR=1 FL=1